MNKKIRTVLLLIFVFVMSAKADVAPDPDEMRVVADLYITTEADVSDYRFFLDFYGDLREVEVKSKASTIIESMGGGARYSSGTLIAIPKNKLKDFSAKPTKEQISAFSNSIKDKSIESIELGKHQFINTIKISHRKNWTYPTYRIEREGNTLRMLKANDITPKISLEEESKMRRTGGVDFALFGISKSLTPLGYMIVVGFPTIAIIVLGIWLFRRKGRKLG